MKRYSKEIYKIFYLVFRLYMYQANTKNCNYNAYGLKINKKTNVSALKFYYNFYYLVYLLKDVGYVKFLINNMVSKYFILSDPRIYYILYLKKKSIMYNKSIVNSKLFYKVTNLKIYFYNDFVLRADMSIFVKNTMYVEYLRLFKYNDI